MDFQGYIRAKGLLNLSIIIRSNSTITLESALNIVRSRVNKNAVLYPDVDIKATLTSYQPELKGNIYDVFSDAWLSKYKQANWYETQLNNVAIQALLNTANDRQTSGGVDENNQREELESIVVFVAENQPVNAPKIAEGLGFSLRTTERFIQTLKQVQAIEYQGSSRWGGYIIKI